MRSARALAFSLCAMLATTAFAQPGRVVYQGFLTDSGGDPVTDTVDLFFALYPASSGGAAVWNETKSDVNIVDGSFAVELSLDETDLTQDDLWIGMAIGSAAEELSRMRVASVPFALRARDADRLGTVAAAGYQLLVTESCPLNEAISAVNADGTVDCLPDDAIGVTTLAGGAGLADLGTMGNVDVLVTPGDGIQVVADIVSVAFGGSGLSDLVARSDHDHPGQFVPAGTMMSCSGGDKVAAIDSITGNVSCLPDANTAYTATGGVAISPDVSGTFDFWLDTTPDVVVGASVYADSYTVSPPVTGRISAHPSDFQPEATNPALYPDYYAPYQGPGTLQSAGSTQVYVPLPLPDGSTVTAMTLFYENPDVTFSDTICCYLYLVNLVSGFVDGGDGVCGDPGGGIQQSTTFVSRPVDNASTAFTARCYLEDSGAVIGDLRLWGLGIDYTYTVMGR